MSVALTATTFLALWQAADCEAPDGFTQVHQSDWEQDMKDQTRETVYRHDESGRFFEVYENRRGAYWSDWDYGEPGCQEVVPETRTVTVYVTRKESA